MVFRSGNHLVTASCKYDTAMKITFIINKTQLLADVDPTFQRHLFFWRILIKWTRALLAITILTVFFQFLYMCQNSNHLENPVLILEACKVSPLFFSPNKQLWESKLLSHYSFPTRVLHSLLMWSRDTPIGLFDSAFLCTVTSINNRCSKSNAVFPNKRKISEAVLNISCPYWCYFGYRLRAVPVGVCQTQKGDPFLKRGWNALALPRPQPSREGCYWVAKMYNFPASSL